MSRWFFLLVSVVLLIAGCGGGKKPKFTKEELAKMPFPQRSGLPEASGGLVLAVGGETITSDEIAMPLIEHFGPAARGSSFEKFEEQARPQLEQILVSRVSNILLYNQAKRDTGVDEEALEKAAEQEVRRFISSFGGDYAKAEEALKEMGMDWASFKEYQQKMMLSQHYIQSKMPEQGPITYSELMDYYNRMREKFFTRPATLKFQLIDIQIAKLELSDPNENRRQQAKKLADELLERLQAGEDFGELALAYSHGHRASFGGFWKPVQPESLAEPYDILAAEAEKIEQGQIAGPIEAGEHIFIMKLEEKQSKGFEPFEKVQSQIEARIIFDRRKKALDEVSAELASQVAVGQRSEFIDFCLQKIYKMSNR